MRFAYEMLNYVVKRELNGVVIKQLIGALTISFVVVVIAAAMTKGQMSKSRMLTLYCATVYVGIIFIITIFRRAPGSTIGVVHLQLTQLNFYDWQTLIWQSIFLGLNVALFVPFGFFVRTLFTKKSGLQTSLIVLFCSFILSLCVEVTQLFTSRGMFELDDLLTNSIGGFCGSIMAAAVMFIIAKRSSRLTFQA